MANLVATPSHVRREFDAIVAQTALKPPTFEIYDSLRGVGGIFIADQWAIIVGMDDMRQIAAAMQRNWPGPLAALLASAIGRRPRLEEIAEWLVWEATSRCIAHEVGHALIYRGLGNPYHPDQEAGADYYAGRLDCARGNNLEIGKMFFQTIGCVGDLCTHPDPANRAAAYTAGYLAQARGVGAR